MNPSRSLVRAFLALYVSLGLAILVESAAIFAHAFGLHAVPGSQNLVVLVYGAGVLFVRIHGVHGYHGT